MSRSAVSVLTMWSWVACSTPPADSRESSFGPMLDPPPLPAVARPRAFCPVSPRRVVDLGHPARESGLQCELPVGDSVPPSPHSCSALPLGTPIHSGTVPSVQTVPWVQTVLSVQTVPSVQR